MSSLAGWVDVFERNGFGTRCINAVWSDLAISRNALNIAYVPFYRRRETKMAKQGLCRLDGCTTDGCRYLGLREELKL